MPTVIDSLVVELGVDPKKFTQGQKDALASFKRTEGEARDRAKSIESSMGRTEQVLSRVQSRFLALISLFVGGVGVKEFITNQTRLNAETGRTAQVFDTTTRALSAWRTVATLTGGTAQGMTGAMGGLISQFQTFSLTGESSVIPYFRALGINVADTAGKMRNMDEIMLDLADRFSKLDPAKARAFGQALGFDEATISLLIRGRRAVADLLQEAKQVGVITKEDAIASAELVKQWNLMETAATSLGRAILTSLTPTMSGVLARFTEIFKEWASGTVISPNSLLGRLLGRNLGAQSFDESGFSGIGGGGAALRTKPGAGSTSVATAALARSLQGEIPELDRFTAFNDTYHALLGRGSAHQRGQALDFTLKNAAESAAVAAKVRQKLAAMGIDARVIDEYANPSAGSTGGHIHVQFNSAAAAQRYSELASGAPGAAVASNVSNRSSSSSSQTTVGAVNVYPPSGDAETIARTIKPAIERNSFATQANSGPQ